MPACTNDPNLLDEEIKLNQGALSAKQCYHKKLDEIPANERRHKKRKMMPHHKKNSKQHTDRGSTSKAVAKHYIAANKKVKLSEFQDLRRRISDQER